MLLAASLVALVLGLTTASWRTAKYSHITHLEYSPSGKYLAAKYSGGTIQVWDLSANRPRLTAQFASRGLFDYNSAPIHFADETTLVDLENYWTGSAYASAARMMDVRTGHLSRSRPIAFGAYAPSIAARGDTLILPNWNVGAVELYDLPSGKLRSATKLAGSPWFVDIAHDGKHLVATDQNGGIFVIDVATGQLLASQTGKAMQFSAADLHGRWLAVSSFSTTGTTGAVDLFDVPTISRSRSLRTDLAYVAWVQFSGDGSRLAVSDYTAFEYYDVASGKRLARLPFHESDLDTDFGSIPMFDYTVPGQNLALSPDGKTLASFRGGQITLRDLPGGKVRQKISGGWRSLQIVIFTLGFAGWAAAWGIVSRRERLRREAEQPAAIANQSPPEIRPANPSPRPAVHWLASVIWLLVAIAVAIALLTFQWSWSPLEVAGYTVLALVGIVVAVIVLAIAYSWIAGLIMGPHYLALVRLRQVTHDTGRLHTRGLLTAVFFGPSNIEDRFESRAAEVLARGRELFGQELQLDRKTMIACLDRQGDFDAYLMRHVPIAAIAPSVSNPKSAIVCEETALRAMSEPIDSFAAGLALLLLIQHKRGMPRGWVSTLCIQRMARRERTSAGLRAAIRRQRVLAIRRPEWDPRLIFARSDKERAALWLAGERPDAWREVHAEIDYLAIRGEMLLGADAPAERREKVLQWLRKLRPKDDPLQTLARDVGLTLDDLIAEQRAWLAAQTGLPYDPLPETKAAIAGAVHAPIIWDRSRTAAERALAVRQIGGGGCVAFVPLLLDELDMPQCDIRFDVIEALENLSGLALGDDPAAWQAWFDALPAETRDWPHVTYARATPEAPLQAVVLDDPLPPAPTSPQPTAPSIPRTNRSADAHPPTELKLCWGMMFLGGCAALTIPIALMFLMGPVFFPTIYFGLFVGVRAIAGGAARETLGLKTIAKLQSGNIIACDPINLLLGAMEFNLLSRPRVLEYLVQANGGRL